MYEGPLAMAQTDREALAALYHATDGPNWKSRTGWDTDADLSHWYGVKTNDQGRVVILSLPGNNLRGPIPSELGKLGALQRLVLWGNKLSGHIPQQLGNLSALGHLDLSWNELDGPIPPELGNLRELSTLWLNINQLTGVIPAELGNFAALRSLDLSGNKLRGPIPRRLRARRRFDTEMIDDTAPSKARSEREREIIVSSDGIRSDDTRRIDSKLYGFRLMVQKHSVASTAPLFGPMVVSKLDERVNIDRQQLQGLLQVECLPDGAVFDPPLLFDFLVNGGDKNDPIVDDFGRVRYEVLSKDSDSELWVRDKQDSSTLQVIQAASGSIYVRAQVRHFCFKGCFKVLYSAQTFSIEDIGWFSRKGGRTNIANNTDGIPIQVYMFRMSQWDAALKNAKTGVEVGPVALTGEVNVDLTLSRNAIFNIPDCTTVYPGGSEFFDVPHYGIFRRKAAFIFVTRATGADGTRRLRIEAKKIIRGNARVTITLPTENGHVSAEPAAVADGDDILSAVLRVIQNCATGSSGTNTPVDGTADH